jgi:4-amino-4-deoxy-L-arabinose transferase-like glycosyltransferase
MNFFKRYKLEIIILVVLSLIYFVLRFCNILSLPIFTDEAIYIRWAQIAKQDANWRFISLTDGKQPMFIWLMMVTLRFVQDPLLAGRVVSVGAGFATMFGLYFLGKEIFKSSKIGLVSSALYVVFPMALVYDRMALYDSLVGTFAVWSLFLTVLLVRKIRLDIALILGMVVGGGVLTKTNAFFSIYLLPFSALLLDWSKKTRAAKLFKWFGLCIVAVVITYGFYSILRLSPFFHIITEKNAIFVYPFSEWLKHPLEFFIGNIRAFLDWIIRYLTWPLLALSLLSFFVNKSFLKEKIVLFLWFITPLLALGFFGRTLYPRFIFFMILPLLPLVAYSLVNVYLKVKNVYVFVVLCLLFFVLAFNTDRLILTDFAKSNVPLSDRSQYLMGWPAGGGVKEAVNFFKKEAEKGKIHIVTQGTFGLMPASLEIYLIQDPNITIEGIWPIPDLIPAKILEKSKKIPTYLVFYQPCPACLNETEAPRGWPLNLIMKINKGQEDIYFAVYKVSKS